MKTIKVDSVRTSEDIINDLLKALDGVEYGSANYISILDHIDTLTTVRERMVDTRNEIRNKGVDVNTVVSGMFGLAGLIAVLNFERADVITSKAFTMATKWLGR